MKLVPLNVKKKASRCMHWVGAGWALALSFAAFGGGLIGLTVSERMGGPGENDEKKALQKDVDRLLDDYRLSQSMHRLIQAAGQGRDVALDLPKALKEDETFKNAFDAQAQATGIALAHARQLSAFDRQALYEQISVIVPQPDFFMKTSRDADSFLGVGRAQSKVMNRPGFQPTLDTAREIVAKAGDGKVIALEWIFGPVVLTMTGAFCYGAARRRLDKSIGKDEESLRLAEEEKQKAETARLAADEAERERIAKIPAAVATALGRDIRVRQIKLAGKAPAPGA